MAQNSNLGDMGFDNLCSSQTGEMGENGCLKVSVSDHVNGLEQSSTRSDSFVVDMERFSRLIEKEINANSRITLQRNLSTKALGRNGERKITSTERDITRLATPPKATIHGGRTPEKPTVMELGAADHSNSPRVHHHQITITNVSTPAAGSKPVAKRFSLRRSHPALAVDPRRILFFFATLSCMGTILLIYFTLSMIKLNGEENALN